MALPQSSVSNSSSRRPATHLRVVSEGTSGSVPAAPVTDVLPALSDAAEERLDASSLQTLLEMLAVMETLEELEMLESLTPGQKRQLWNATPNDLKARLVKIRQTPPSPSVSPPSAPIVQQAVKSPRREGSDIQVGDRVVLKAKAELKVAELKAIFEVVAIEEEMIHVKDAQNRNYHYLQSWLLRYS